MKQGNALIAAVAMAVLFIGSQTVYALPGEGPYIGVFVGHGGGHVSAKATSDAGDAGVNASTSGHAAGTYEMAEGGFGLEGTQYGGWAGYGLRLSKLYAGFEIEGVSSGEKFELKSSRNIELDEDTNITSVTAEKEWEAGGAFRLGYYLNPSTLVAVKYGVSVSEFKVNGGYTSDVYTAGGYRLGVSMDSAVWENLSLRLEYVVTDYLTADVGDFGTDADGVNDGQPDIELSGMDYAGRIGLAYSFGNIF